MFLGSVYWAPLWLGLLQTEQQHVWTKNESKNVISIQMIYSERFINTDHVFNNNPQKADALNQIINMLNYVKLNKYDYYRRRLTELTRRSDWTVSLSAMLWLDNLPRCLLWLDQLLRLQRCDWWLRLQVLIAAFWTNLWGDLEHFLQLIQSFSLDQFVLHLHTHTHY